MSAGSTPSQVSPKTAKAYRSRMRQLVNAAQAELGTPMSSTTFTDWLLRTAYTLAAPSWRAYKAAVRYCLADAAANNPRDAAQAEAAIAKIVAFRHTPPPDLPARTSARKAKAAPDSDLKLIARRLTSSASPYAKRLALYLNANLLAGARPNDWRGSALVRSEDKLTLTLTNSKCDDVRAHGPTRTLHFQDLTPANIRALEAWVGWANAGSAADYEGLMESLGNLLRDVCAELFPRRKKRIAPYTIRHEVCARWKDVYMSVAQDDAAFEEGAAIVAALMGHATDSTATQHYARGRGKRRSGKGRSRYPIPKPCPLEVARIRKTLMEKRSRLAAVAQARTSGAGPSL